MTKILTPIQISEICDLFLEGKHTYSSLAKIYPVSKDSIRSLLLRRGILNNKTKSESRRQYVVYENYFETINTQEKAYFLGFLYADGYNDTKRGIVNISLQERDKSILEVLNKLVHPEKKIYFISKEYERLKGVKKQDQYRIHISSKKISKDLEKLGCLNAKTFTLKFPTEEQVPKHLIQHFIRGFFDGDGSVSKDINFTGTFNMLNNLKLHLKEVLDVHFSLFECKRTKNIYSLQSGGRIQMLKILEYLYKDSVIHLDRKYEKFLLLKISPNVR